MIRIGRSALFACLLCFPVVAQCQRLLVTVLAADSSSPAAFVPVEVRDSVGTLVVRTGTGANGKASISLPRSGPYVVRALRMGFRPTDAAVRLGTGSQSVTLTMSSTPVEISGMRVEASDKCRMSPDDGRRFLEVRDQSRAFLDAQVRDARRGPTILVGPRFYGRADMDRTHQRIDSSKTTQAILTGPLQVASAEEIATRGFVAYADSNTRAAYEFPSPEIVLSDAFLATHCFRVRRQSIGGERQIGLGFTPIAFAEAIVDISGTLWLDSVSGTPRRLEFDYMNLAPTPDQFTVDRNNGRAIGVLVRAAPPLGIGQIDYVVVQGPQLIPRAWILKTPDVRWLNVVDTRISLGQADGRVLYQDASLDSVAARLFRQLDKRKNSAAFAGVIRDQAGQPIADAVVTVSEVGRLALTDSAGRYSLNALPVRAVQVRVNARCHAPIVFRLPLIGDSTRKVDLTLTPGADSSC